MRTGLEGRVTGYAEVSSMVHVQFCRVKAKVDSRFRALESQPGLHRRRWIELQLQQRALSEGNQDMSRSGQEVWTMSLWM